MKLNSDDEYAKRSVCFYKGKLALQILVIPERNVKQVLPVYAELDFAKAELLISQLLGTKEHKSDSHGVLHEFKLADMTKPVKTGQVPIQLDNPVKHSKPPKPSVIVNKQTQSFEKQFTYEFILTFPHPRKLGVDYPSREVVLFAKSEEERALWVKHLDYVYQSVILDLLNESLFEDESDEGGVFFKRHNHKSKKPNNNKIGVMLPTSKTAAGSSKEETTIGINAKLHGEMTEVHKRNKVNLPF